MTGRRQRQHEDEDASLETASLLRSAASPRPKSPATTTQSIRSVVLTILSSASVVFLLDIGNSLSLAPQTAILEGIVCRQYYERNHPANLISRTTTTPWTVQGRMTGERERDMCKLEPIQSEVAFINGWKDVFETLPGVLLAVPFGVLADRIAKGRRRVMLLAAGGLVLGEGWVRLVYWFPDFFGLRAVWFSGLWQIIGAGGATLSSMVFAQLADVVPAEQRTAAFSILASSTLVSQLVFVPIGAGLMKVGSAWVPTLISFGLGVLSLVVGWFLVADTNPVKTRDTDDDQGDGAGEDDHPRLGKKGVWLHVKDLVGKGREVVRSVARNWNTRAALVLLSTFCFSLAIMSDSTLLLQYASKRLGWTIGEASILLSVRAGVGLLVLALFLPLLSSYFLVRLNLHESLKDKRIAQASGVFLSLGAAMIFLADAWIPLFLGQVIFAVGFAYTATTRSLLATTVDETQRGTAFTALSVFMQAGFLIGSPLLAAAFKWGMRLGESWAGMPFLVAAGFSVVGTLAVSSVSIARRSSSNCDNEFDAGEDDRGLAV